MISGGVNHKVLVRLLSDVTVPHCLESEAYSACFGFTRVGSNHLRFHSFPIYSTLSLSSLSFPLYCGGEPLWLTQTISDAL